MKAIKLITLTLLTLMNLPFTSCAKDDKGHTLTKLWAEYEKAVNADRPKDQADILERIKKEASAQHLAWDYYDACWKYVEARTSTNWKLRDELTAQANEEIEKNGEPVAVFYNRRSSNDAESLLEYVNEKKAQLLQAHNPEFYDNDHNVNAFVFSPALLPRIANDYEYALWCLLRKSSSLIIRNAVREHFAGRYPFDALAEYQILQYEGATTADVERLMEKYAADHAG